MIKKKMLLFLLIFLVLPTVQAVEIGQGVIFNTSISSSSMTFSFPVTVGNVTIRPLEVSLRQVDYIKLGDPFHCDFLNHSLIDFNLDSIDFVCINLGEVLADGTGGGVAPPPLPPPTPDNETTNVTIEEVSETQQLLKQIQKSKEQKESIVKIIIWVFLLQLLIILALITDYLRQEKKINPFVQTMIILLVAVGFFFIGWSAQNILLDTLAEINLAIILIAGSAVAIILILVAFGVDKIRKSSKN